jgi:transcriptional regulator with XRE-family HTH domain
MSEISLKIKEIRKVNNLSQDRFGKKLGISGKTISAYETGRAVPPEKVINAISIIFSTPIIYMSSDDRCRLKDQLTSVRMFVENIEKVLSEY